MRADRAIALSKLEPVVSPKLAPRSLRQQRHPIDLALTSYPDSSFSLNVVPPDFQIKGRFSTVRAFGRSLERARFERTSIVLKYRFFTNWNWHMRGCIFFLAVVAATISSASAGERRRPSVVWFYEPPLESRGCYWYQQHQFCGRYCYTEIDGRRFCRETPFEAVPQAPGDPIVAWDGRPAYPSRFGTGSVR
jgi:hypothetical protein